jgi:serine/threonine protein kinase/Flp pilus assembly protein TadD
MSISSGTKLGRYEIRSQLGAGGMGEVYLAQDTKLERTVALKILPAEVAADRNRMNRFVLEAKAASALNHPNIITIFEIEQVDSVNFIATEFIDGKTLRESMRNATMKLGEVLEVAIQSASALSAAHDAGIVHRDIKPENIMLRRDGIVKVLDFGLAKLSEQRSSTSVDIDAATLVLIKTDPGMVIGTAFYMSPEQARGLEVDARTDIFSLGVLLYEMIAGRLPFEGSNTNEILASILGDKEPSPLARYAREVPAELERIVSKALRKNREERYQTIKDMLLDLKSLKQRLEFDAEVERSRPPEMTGDQTTAAVTPPTLSGQTAQTIPITESLLGRIKHHRRSLMIALLELIVAAVGLTYFIYFVVPARKIDSIAVLPFTNASGDPNTEYLSDGISEALINSLTELPGLRVIARSTAFHYKGKEVNPQAVGRELNVRAVLMGRVRQLGDTLNIQVDLVDATTGAQLWGQEYERKASDVLSIKQAVAREVTEKLRLRLSGDEQRQLTKRDTTNAESFQFYLRGRYYWSKRTGEGIKKAIEQFQQAIDRDPNYALGYVGLADCYLVLEQYAGVPASESLPKARAAADRALQIDDSLAEARTSSAFIYHQQWRWTEAEEEFKRAITLNPNYPTAHHWFAYYLYTKRQFDDAMREIKRAQEVDPLSPVISENVALVYFLKNDLNSAIEQCQRTIELDPRFADAHYILGFAYLKQRRNEEATADFQKAVQLSGRAATYLSNLGYCYAVTGRRAEALAILKELEEKHAKRESTGQFLAGVYAGLGDKDQAFAWLERDFQQRSGQLPTITWRPHFENLRSDARYADLLHRMGLKP